MSSEGNIVHPSERDAAGARKAELRRSVILSDAATELDMTVEQLHADLAIAKRARETERKSSQQDTWHSWNACLDHILGGAA